MKHITSLLILSFILYCSSNSFVSAFLSPKRTLIKKYIRNKYAQQKLIAEQRQNDESWIPLKYSSSIGAFSLDEDCIKFWKNTFTQHLRKVKAEEIAGIVVDLKLRAEKGKLFSKKDDSFNKEYYTKRHYTLFVEAPGPLTNTWVLHVVHDGKKNKKFYCDKLQGILDTEVKIEFSIYDEYPFESKELDAEIETIGSYISWVTYLTGELRDMKPRISLQDVRKAISQMNSDEWKNALAADRMSRLSVHVTVVIIKQHIERKHREQKQIVTQRQNDKSWRTLPQNFLMEKHVSEESCIILGSHKLEQSLRDIKAGKMSGVVCDFKPRTFKPWHSETESHLSPEGMHYTERHYTLFVEAPELSTNTWILHVVHGGEERKQFYDVFRERMADILTNEKDFPEQTVEPVIRIDFSRYDEYPLETGELTETETKTIASYISWVTCLTKELRNQKLGISSENVRTFLYKMNPEKRRLLLETYQTALLTRQISIPDGTLLDN